MRFVKGISICFFLSLILLLSGFFVGYYVRGSVNLVERGNRTLGKTSQSKELEKVEEKAPIVSREALAGNGNLCVNTVFIVDEYNLDEDIHTESEWSLPQKYIGMNREEFIEALELYLKCPPLIEKTKGLNNIQLVSFSREKTVIRKDYSLMQECPGYYAAVYNNKVIIYMADQKTVFLETNILLENLPDSLQEKVINMMYISDEKSLYDLLENYSS